MAEPPVPAAQAEQGKLLNQHGEEVHVVLPFLMYNSPKREDKDNIDLVSLEDEFDSSDEQNDLLSYYPDELDFYDQKHGQISRRNGGKKLSGGRKAKEKSPRNLKVLLPSSKTICKRIYDSETGKGKEQRIKNSRIENSRLKKEKNTKAKKAKGSDVSEREKNHHSSCLMNSAKKTAPKSNETANPPTFYNHSDFVLGSEDWANSAVEFDDQSFINVPSFYNNSDFLLGSGDWANSAVKFDDQSFINLLIELQNREITPEDYDLLVQLDCSVKPKTLSKAKIDSLHSDNITNATDDICSICIEDYISGDNRRFLACGHHFHDHCIRTWLSITSNRCPIDGKEVR